MSAVAKSIRARYIENAFRSRPIRDAIDTWAENEKVAEIGGTPSSSFEQAFANLAHSYLKDIAAKLMDYHVGFQLLEKSRDNTRAVGIFGFKIGDDWMFAPVFFLNGELKGHELLYSKNQDLFMPLKDNWVNCVLGRKPLRLGVPRTQTEATRGQVPPDLARMRFPPVKYASATPHWFSEVFPDLAAAATVPWNQSGESPRSFLTAIKYAGDQGLQYLDTLQAQYPTIYADIEECYGKEKIASARMDARTFAEEGDPGNILRAVYPALRPQAEKKAEASVTVILKREVSANGNALKLPTKQQKELLSTGRLIDDSRDPNSVASVYDVETPLRLQNPDQTGIYSILTAGGNIERCAVLTHTLANGGTKGMATIVSLDRPARWTNVASLNDVYALHDSTPFSAFSDWVKSKPKIDTFPKKDKARGKPGTRELYMILTPGGTSTAPFSVAEVYHEEGDVAHVMDVDWSYQSWSPSKPRHVDGPGLAYYTPYGPKADRSYSHDMPCCPSSTHAHLHMIRLMPNRKGHSFRRVGDELYVPGDVHWITLQQPDPYHEPTHSKDHILVPGDPSEVLLSLRPVSKELEITRTGDAVRINKKSVDKEAAFKHLVVDWNMAVETADAILEKAAAGENQGRTLRFLVKQADTLLNGPSGPAFPDTNERGVDDMANGIMSETTAFRSIPVKALGMRETARTAHNPQAPLLPDSETLSLAQEAATSGQREVFDTALLGGLLKTVGKETMIRRFMPDLVKGMDRLGRILFQLYWHRSQFEKMYPKSELPEIEDAVRNTFEAMGDIVLKLKTTAPTTMDVDGLHVDIEGVADQ